MIRLSAPALFRGESGIRFALRLCFHLMGGLGFRSICEVCEPAPCLAALRGACVHRGCQRPLLPLKRQHKSCQVNL